MKIILRGDSGFCRNELMSWCEGRYVDHVFGLGTVQLVNQLIWMQEAQANQQWNRPEAGECSPRASATRRVGQKNRGWSRERRVVAKAEHIDGKQVTLRSSYTARPSDGPPRRLGTKNCTAHAARWKPDQAAIQVLFADR